MKRPEFTQEIIELAAIRLTEQMGELRNAEIAKHYLFGDNGFELAKSLESYECWDIDLDVVEHLDCMDSLVDEIHREACIKWVKDNDIKPELRIGTHIKEGEITGVSEYSPACYEVKIYGHDDEKEGKSRRIIRFEDAVCKEND